MCDVDATDDAPTVRTDAPAVRCTSPAVEFYISNRVSEASIAAVARVIATRRGRGLRLA